MRKKLKLSPKGPQQPNFCNIRSLHFETSLPQALFCGSPAVSPSLTRIPQKAVAFCGQVTALCFTEVPLPKSIPCRGGGTWAAASAQPDRRPQRSGGFPTDER